MDDTPKIHPGVIAGGVVVALILLFAIIRGGKAGQRPANDVTQLLPASATLEKTPPPPPGIEMPQMAGNMKHKVGQ